MTVHRIPASALIDKEYCVTCSWDVMWNGRKYSLGVSPEGRPAREYFQGPETTDRFAWISEQAVMIAAWYPPDPPRIELSHGDVLNIDGHGAWLIEMVEQTSYSGRGERRGQPRITPIAAKDVIA